MFRCENYRKCDRFRGEIYWPENYKKMWRFFVTKFTDQRTVENKTIDCYKNNRKCGTSVINFSDQKILENVTIFVMQTTKKRGNFRCKIHWPENYRKYDILSKNVRNSNRQEDLKWSYFLIKNNKLLLTEEYSCYWSEHNLIHDNQLITATLLNDQLVFEKKEPQFCRSIVSHKSTNKLTEVKMAFNVLARAYYKYC